MKSFTNEYDFNLKEKSLVLSAQQGNKSALDELLATYRSWIYNITIRMLGSPQEAEDLTQDILLKIVKNLSGFQHKSSFRTWLYQITVRTIFDMKRSNREKHFSSFEQHRELLNSLMDEELPDKQNASPDMDVLIEETRYSCMMGMLLCLNREQRIVFILGGVLGFDSTIGSEFLDISPSNFRQLLSRAKKDLYNYMNNKCSLIKSTNPCSCTRKTNASIKAGLVDPLHLKYHQKYLSKISSVVKSRIEKITFENLSELSIEEIYQDQPFWEFFKNTSLN